MKSLPVSLLKDQNINTRFLSQHSREDSGYNINQLRYKPPSNRVAVGCVEIDDGLIVILWRFAATYVRARHTRAEMPNSNSSRWWVLAKASCVLEKRVKKVKRGWYYQ